MDILYNKKKYYYLDGTKDRYYSNNQMASDMSTDDAKCAYSHHHRHYHLHMSSWLSSMF